MKKSVIMLWIITSPLMIKANYDQDYLVYHKRITHAEELIGAKSFDLALEVYQQLFETFEFIFLRDYQVATQLAWHLGENEKAFRFLKLGTASGWQIKSIKKNKFLKGLRATKEWRLIQDQDDSLKGFYTNRIDSELRSEVRKMMMKDQSKALGALFKFSAKGQDRYAERKFAPNNEKQVYRLIEIIRDYGYPGEKLIGNDTWMQTILSHHNSISQAYCQKDTMYQYLNPQLLAAIKKGQMSPSEFAVIDDWFITVKNGWEIGSYGYLAGLKEETMAKASQLRSKIGLRKVANRNRLIDIQEQTGMNFYLPVWPKKNGKIQLAQ